METITSNLIHFFNSTAVRTEFWYNSISCLKLMLFSKTSGKHLIVSMETPYEFGSISGLKLGSFIIFDLPRCLRYSECPVFADDLKCWINNWIFKRNRIVKVWFFPLNSCGIYWFQKARVVFILTVWKLQLCWGIFHFRHVNIHFIWKESIHFSVHKNTEPIKSIKYLSDEEYNYQIN